MLDNGAGLPAEGLCWRFEGKRGGLHTGRTDGRLSEAGEKSSGRPRGETNRLRTSQSARKTLIFFLEQHDSDGGRTLEENYECVGWQTAAVAAVVAVRELGRGGDECKKKKKKREKRFYCMRQMVFPQNDWRGKKK